MPHEFQRFVTEEEAVACATKNRGVVERQDWKTLPVDEQKKPWIAKWGDGIEPPQQVDYAELMNPVPILKAKVAECVALVAGMSLQVSQLTQQMSELRAEVGKIRKKE